MQKSKIPAIRRTSWRSGSASGGKNQNYKLKFKIFLLSSFFPLLSSASIFAEEPTLTLKEAVEEALKNNPQIQAQAKRYEAAKARIPQASALKDPVIGIEYEQIPKRKFKFTDAPMRMYSVSQEVPFPTKLILRSKIASKSAKAAYEEYKETQRKVISEVKSAYAELFLVHKSIEIEKENKALLEQFAESAASRYSLGKASQQDALKAQVEIARIDSALVILEQDNLIAQARLNILLNRKPEELLGAPQAMERQKFSRGLDELYALAKENRPELKAYRHMVEKGKSQLALAKNEYLPDFMVEVEQREMDSRLDGWDAFLGVSVPLWFFQKQNYNVKEMRSELRMLESEYKSIENAVLFETRSSLAKVGALVRLVELYKTSFLPQTEQALKASLTGYEANMVDFLNLLDSQRMLLDFKVDYYRTLVGLEIAMAELERAVGVDLE